VEVGGTVTGPFTGARVHLRVSAPPLNSSVVVPLYPHVGKVGSRVRV
jgi:hypothetical protein